jgi:hypothetical protein
MYVFHLGLKEDERKVGRESGGKGAKRRKETYPNHSDEKRT